MIGRVSGGQLSHAACPGRIWRVVGIWVTGGRGARLPVRSTRGEQARLRTGVTGGVIAGPDAAAPQTVLARSCRHQAETGYRSNTQDAFHGLASLPLQLPGSALRSGDRRAVNLDEDRGVRGRQVSHPDRRGDGSRARIETLPDPNALIDHALPTSSTRPAAHAPTSSRTTARAPAASWAPAR